jgi:hypothetical protein
MVRDFHCLLAGGQITAGAAKHKRGPGFRVQGFAGGGGVPRLNSAPCLAPRRYFPTPRAAEVFGLRLPVFVGALVFMAVWALAWRHRGDMAASLERGPTELAEQKA